MKKICLFITNLKTGGAERVLVNMANEFYIRGYNVDVVLMKAEGEFLAFLNSKIRVIDLMATRLLKTLPKFIRYIHREKPDLVIAFMWPITLLSIWATFLSGNFKKIKLIVTEHSSWSNELFVNKFHLWFTKWSLRIFYPFSDAIIHVSKGSQNDFLNFVSFKFDTCKLRYIYNPVVHLPIKLGSKALIPESWCMGDHQKILAVGNLKEIKDYVTLIKAFKMVHGVKKVKLLILGEGPMRVELEALIQNLNLIQDCILYGHVSNPDGYYLLADVFVLSSIGEGLPTVMIEALKNGVTVVSTDCPHGPREILANGKYGYLVPVGDIQKLAFAMMNALENPGNKDDLQSRAGIFSVNRAVDKYIRILEQV